MILNDANILRKQQLGATVAFDQERH